MQTRRLRLGDVVDDYCPRERRLSNHVIVAMVDDTIKQTRCSTCDFEHPYKEAKVPARRKKKDGTEALFQQVLENVIERPASAGADAAALPAPSLTASSVASPNPPGPNPSGAALATSPPAAAVPAPATRTPRGVLRPNGAARDAQDDAGETLAAAAGASPAGSGSEPPAAERPVEEDAPLHRRTLIRATLPRTVGDVPVRQIPSFTVREAAAARPNKFRFKGRPGGGGRPQGVGMSGNQARPAGGGRGPQGRGAGKKSGGPPAHRAGGHQPSRPKGPHGNKRFK